jgi:hypothetical protein
MSHFYADIKGSRGEVTRQGTKQSGVHGHIRGWNVGVYVEIGYDEIAKKDVVKVYRTGGSNNPIGEPLVEFEEGGPVNFRPM